MRKIAGCRGHLCWGSLAIGDDIAEPPAVDGDVVLLQVLLKYKVAQAFLQQLLLQFDLVDRLQPLLQVLNLFHVRRLHVQLLECKVCHLLHLGGDCLLPLLHRCVLEHVLDVFADLDDLDLWSAVS